MRIVHIIPTLNIGGAEKVLNNLINYHQNSFDFQHSIIFLKNKGTLGQNLSNLNIKVYELNINSIFNLPYSFFKLISHLRNEKYDIIQTWMYHSDLIGGLAAYFTGNKNIIWCVRNSEILYSGGISKSAILFSKICSFLSYYIPKVIVYNSEIGRCNHEKMGYDSTKSIVVSNPISIAMSNSQKDIHYFNFKNHFIIGSVGRFNKYKDQLTFIEAATLLLEQNKNFIFFLIGRGNNLNNLLLKKYLVNSRYVNNFVLLDEVENVFDYYKIFDVFCLHSLSEAFPNVLAEAMLSGCLCITTDVGDARKIIGDCGIVIKKSSPIMLANAIIKMVNYSSHEKDLIKISAIKRIKTNYSEQVIYPKLEKIYKNLKNE